MFLNNFFCNGEPYTCSFILFPVVQSLKNYKDAVQVNFIETNAVVF